MDGDRNVAVDSSFSADNVPALLLTLFLVLSFVGVLTASDWSDPARQLARKIAAVTGPGAVSITLENRSSLAKKDFDAIGGLLRIDMESLGLRAVAEEQAAASVHVTFSENPQFYVWVAEIRQGNADPAVAIVSLPRRDEIGVVHDSMPMSLRKIPLWAQESRILDVSVLDDDSAPQHIAVLDGEKVAIYRQKNGKWQTEQTLAITHARPWPHDLRGLLVPAKDHLFDVYLPGRFCQTSVSVPLSSICRASDYPAVAKCCGSTASARILCRFTEFFYLSPHAGSREPDECRQVLFGGGSAANALRAVAVCWSGWTGASRGRRKRAEHEVGLGQRPGEG